jgi:hypothetical protein
MADGDSVFEQYWRHSKDLRQWFVAYGVGAILFMTSKDTASAVQGQSSGVTSLAAWFFVGAAIQVILVFLNRMYSYYLFLDEIRPDKPGVSGQHVARVISGEIRITIPSIPGDSRSIPLSGELVVKAEQVADSKTQNPKWKDAFWWIDGIGDIATMILYAIGTLRLFGIF